MVQETILRIAPRSCQKSLDWDKHLAKKIWCVGPETTGPNVVVDMCKGVQYLNEIKDSVVAGFQWASEEGALAEENKRGICFEVCDVVLPADASHRGGGEVIPNCQEGYLCFPAHCQDQASSPVYLVLEIFRMKINI